MKLTSSFKKLTVAAVFVAAISIAGQAQAGTHTVTLSPSSGPIPVDNTLTISVQGSLSWGTEPCTEQGVSEPGHGIILGAATEVIGNVVRVVSGPFVGESIPVYITQDGADGDCPDAAGGRSTLYASDPKTFDTRTLSDGDYSMNLEVRDDWGQSRIATVNFTIQHGGSSSDLSVSCSGSPSAANIQEDINWSARTSGGTGTYTYSWSGTDGLSGSRANVTKSYNVGGVKDATIRVTSGGITKQASCSVSISDINSTPICSPDNQSAKVGDVLNFSVTNGIFPFTWQANYGDPSTKGPTTNPTDRTFQTKFTVAGPRVAKVTDDSGNLSRCDVNVTPANDDPPPCTIASTISVTSNKPSTWALTGPENFSQAVPATSATYNPALKGSGTYTLTPGTLAGYTAEVAPLATQSVTCGTNLSYAITYTPVGPPEPPVGGGPALRVDPPSVSIQVGETTCLSAMYDPDGSGSQTERDVTGPSAWSSADPSIASSAGTCSNLAKAFFGKKVGITRGIATYGGLTAEGIIEVTQGPPPDLSVFLAPNPDQGYAPLTTTLKADVGGLATGPINYYFWKNCNYVGGLNPTVAGAVTKCNTWDAKYDNVNSPTKSSVVTYPTPIVGYATAMVIVERGGYTDQAAAAVIVRPPVEPQTHKECVANACTIVNGVGPNRCSSSSDCGSGPPFGGVCDAVQMACVNRAGGGSPSCASDPACSGIGFSHLECQNQSCVIVGGAGVDGCTGVGSQCGVIIPPGGGSCTFTPSPKLIPKGGTSTLTWVCTGITACTVTNTATGAIEKTATLPPNGVDSTAVQPATTTVYALNCDSGVFATTTTVRVLSIIEVPPR